MARKKKVEVQKFGGTDDLGNVKMHGYDHDVKSVEVQSQTKLESDEGYGNAVVIRMFEFGVNPESFKRHQPTKQELFNSHSKGIEAFLWRDGLQVISEVEPRIVFNKKQTTYKIFIGARPKRGEMLTQAPHTLSQLLAREEING